MVSVPLSLHLGYSLCTAAVISGRRASILPPLSSNMYISSMIPWPDRAVNSPEFLELRGSNIHGIPSSVAFLPHPLFNGPSVAPFPAGGNPSSPWVAGSLFFPTTAARYTDYLFFFGPLTEPIKRSHVVLSSVPYFFLFYSFPGRNRAAMTTPIPHTIFIRTRASVSAYEYAECCKSAIKDPCNKAAFR